MIIGFYRVFFYRVSLPFQSSVLAGLERRFCNIQSKGNENGAGREWASGNCQLRSHWSEMTSKEDSQYTLIGPNPPPLPSPPLQKKKPTNQHDQSQSETTNERAAFRGVFFFFAVPGPNFSWTSLATVSLHNLGRPFLSDTFRTQLLGLYEITGFHRSLPGFHFHTFFSFLFFFVCLAWWAAEFESALSFFFIYLYRKREKKSNEFKYVGSDFFFDCCRGFLKALMKWRDEASQFQLHKIDRVEVKDPESTHTHTHLHTHTHTHLHTPTHTHTHTHTLYEIKTSQPNRVNWRAQSSSSPFSLSLSLHSFLRCHRFNLGLPPFFSFPLLPLLHRRRYLLSLLLYVTGFGFVLFVFFFFLISFHFWWSASFLQEKRDLSFCVELFDDRRRTHNIRPITSFLFSSFFHFFFVFSLLDFFKFLFVFG